jgi:hypothetical protein
MGNLSNLYISQSFISLIHLGTDSSITTQSVELQDGLGNGLGIFVNSLGDVVIEGEISASNIPSEITSLGQFNAYTASTNIRLNNIEISTASLNSSVTQLNASSASQQVSINALNSYTASFSTASIDTSIANLNSFTSSANVRLNNLESTSASVNVSISNINQFTQSALVSINALNAATSSYVTETESGSFLITASFNNGTRDLTFTKGNNTTFAVNIPDVSGSSSTNTGSLMVTGSVNVNVLTFTKGDGSTFSLTVAASGSAPAGTISGSAQITALGFVSSSVTASSLITASFDNGTRNLTFTKGDNTTFAVNIPDVSGSAGNFVTTSSFNAYTASNDQRVSSLEIATSSLYTSASLSLITASVSGQLLSFTKGNNSVFSVTLPTGSGTYVTGSYGAFHDETTQSGSANTPHLVKFSNTDISDGVILSGSTGLKVGAYGVYNLQFSLQAKRVSGSGTDTLDVWFRKNGIDIPWSNTSIGLDGGVEATRVVPAWNYMDTLNINDTLEIVWQASDANVQLIAEPASGSLPAIPSAIATLNRVDVGGGSNSVSTSSFNAYTSSTNTIINGLSAKTGSYATTGSNTFIADQIISGSIFVSQSKEIQLGDLQIGSVYRGIKINTSVDGNSSINMYGTASAELHIGIVESDFSEAHELFIQPTLNGVLFNTLDTTFTYVPFMRIDNGTNDKPIFTKGIEVTGSTNIAELTASLQQGYVWVGNASGITTTVATSSFGGGGGVSFPYTGSALITGSLGITGSLNGFVNTLTIAANTASLDFNSGNFFTLQLVSGSITHLTAANIKAGQTINLLVKTDSGSAAASGSLTFSPTFKFAGGFDYTPTAITASQDLVSFVTFDTTQIFAAQVKNLS